MVTNLVLVVGTLLVGLVTPSPGARSRTSPVVVASSTMRMMRLATTVDSFSPPPPRAKKRKPATPRSAPAGSSTKARSDEDDTDENSRPTTTTPAARRQPATPEDQEQEDGAGGDEEDEGDPPKAKRKPGRRRASSDEEEEEDDDDAPLTAFPIVLPRLISFGAGGSLMGRTFAFNTPLQKESTFPRPGFLLALESFPLIRAGAGWLRQLGIGADLAMEFGTAGLTPAGGGPTTSFPVSQRRYAFDVRYVFIPGERVVILPALGIGNNTFDLKTNNPIPPSTCNNASTVPCVAGVQVTYLVADVHLRVAATEAFSVTLSGGYQLGLAVGQGRGQIGQERSAKMSGLHAELGANWMLMDWLAVRFAVPFISHAFTFSGGTAPYTTAKETYFGGTVSVILFTQ